jgi:hypothetical protein
MWLALVLVWWAPAGATPVVDRLSPAAGQVGQVVVLEGTDLAGAVVEVKFGRAPALEAGNPGGSGKVIQLLVPNKVDPRDPSTVIVTVTIDGVEASASGPPLQFTYSIPQPSPAITDIATGDPSRPRSVSPDRPFVLTLTGSNFLIARRVPQRCLALGGDEKESDALVGPLSDTSVSFSFPGLRAPGDYEFMIAFSDGSQASIEAPGFVEPGSIFGSPPIINSLSVSWNPQEFVECDFTNVVETYVCSQGIEGARADSAIKVGGSFTHVSFQARVTDPDSTPEQSNVLLVSASFVNPDTRTETSLVLFDDGSAAQFPFPQRASLPEDCMIDAFGTCTCSRKFYPLVSKDAVSRDDLFSRDVAFVDRSTPSLALLQDCIMEQKREPSIVLTSGTTVEFGVDAVDRQGNLVTWPMRPTVTSGTGTFSCGGDECGCCILTSPAPALDCHGKPGMPSTDHPEGVCMSVY